jgi:predicted amidohydrolase
MEAAATKTVTPTVATATPSPAPEQDAEEPGLGGLKVAAVCMNPETDKEANLEVIFSYMRGAAEQGVHLIAFPAVALQQNPCWASSSSTYQPTEEELAYLRDSAEAIPGESTDRLVALAKELSLHVVLGMTEKGTGDALYNASVLLGPDGVLGSCRAMYLWDSSTYGGNEDLFWQKGTEVGVFASPLGKIGLLTQIDMFFGLGKNLVEAGAEVLVTIAAWQKHQGMYLNSTAQSTAAQNKRWHIVSNQVGRQEHMMTYGHSVIVSPDGKFVADTGEEEGMAVAETGLPVAF